ncbi:MAG: hypothetical protein QOH88_3436 [Verrucomicrobiota bacterium]|jgi:hypothetical protein
MLTKSKPSLEKLWDVENQFSALAGSATGRIAVGAKPNPKRQTSQATLRNKILENVERIRKSIGQVTVAHAAGKPVRTVVQEDALVEYVRGASRRLVAAESRVSGVVAKVDRPDCSWINDVLRRTAEDYIEKGQKSELDFLLAGGADWLICDTFGLSQADMANIRHGLVDGIRGIIISDVVDVGGKRRRKSLHAAKVSR